MIDFIDIARRCLQPLTEQDFTLQEERHCRAEVRLKYQRADREIWVSYEPFGPPCCDLRRAGCSEQRLEITSDFPSSIPLATTPGFAFPERLLQAHTQELENWCRRLLTRLEAEKIIT